MQQEKITWAFENGTRKIENVPLVYSGGRELIKGSVSLKISIIAEHMVRNSLMKFDYEDFDSIETKNEALVYKEIPMKREVEENVEWCYSLDGEHFDERLSTRTQAVEEAIKCGREQNPDKEYVWVGKVKDVSVGIDVEELLDGIGERAYDEAGEIAENYLTSVKKEHQAELEKELNKVIELWMLRHNYKPTFYRVEDIERITL